jgi:hypothetical protein
MCVYWFLGSSVFHSEAEVDGAALQHVLGGETFVEKERRLSEMILQLQMVRDQLLVQQEQQSKVGPHFLHNFKGWDWIYIELKSTLQMSIRKSCISVEISSLMSLFFQFGNFENF